MITLLRVNAFINWILLGTLAKFLSGRNPDAAFKCELGAMASYQVFLDPSILPPDLLDKVKRRMKIAGLMVLGFWITLLVL